jgi:ferredoxin
MSDPFDFPPSMSSRVTELQKPTLPEATVSVTVGVDNNHCHLYAICQHEAPGVFELRRNRRLVVAAHPPAHLLEQVRSAARLCPMQAITVEVSS